MDFKEEYQDVINKLSVYESRMKALEDFEKEMETQRKTLFLELSEYLSGVDLESLTVEHLESVKQTLSDSIKVELEKSQVLLTELEILYSEFEKLRLS